MVFRLTDAVARAIPPKTMQDLADPSDHLLRMLAAVPVSSQILDFGCGQGRHTIPLLRLGFPVHACDPRPAAVEATRSRVADLIGEESAETSVQVTPLDSVDYPDATFNWVISSRAEIYAKDSDELETFFEATRRVLKPGGWLYLSLPAGSDDATDSEAPGFSVETIESKRVAADLSEASEPTETDGEGVSRIRAVYRRVEPRTPV